MAIILLNNNKMITVTPEQGLTIWQILNGQITGNEKQMKYCENVKDVYLNIYSSKTPELYKKQKRHLLPKS